MLPLPKLTKALMLVCIGFFCLQELWPPLLGWLALWPVGSAPFWPWQLLSYALLHGGVAHLFFNMLMLFSFGPMLEEHLGARRLAVLLLVSILTAALVQLGVQAARGVPAVTVGLSGGLFGLLLATGLAFGERTMLLVIPPIPMKIKWLVVIFGSLELAMGVSGRSGVAHFAHLGGMLGAFALWQWWRWRGRRRPPLRRVH